MRNYVRLKFPSYTCASPTVPGEGFTPRCHAWKDLQQVLNDYFVDDTLCTSNAINRLKTEHTDTTDILYST